MCSNTTVTHAELGKRLGVSRAAVSQVFNGRAFLTRATLEVVAAYLGHGDRLPFLLTLHTLSGKPRNPRRPSPQSRDLELGLEAMAETITVVEYIAMPDLLRCRPYAQFFLSLSHPESEISARLVDLERRQNVFTAPSPVRLTWFTDQHFFHRLAATTPRAHLDAQLRHLVHLGESGVLNLRIVPTGDPRTIPSPPFYLLVSDDGHTCAYERGILATQHTNDPDDLAVYNRVVDSLDRAALDAASAFRWLQNVLGPRGAS